MQNIWTFAPNAEVLNYTLRKFLCYMAKMNMLNNYIFFITSSVLLRTFRAMIKFRLVLKTGKQLIF